MSAITPDGRLVAFLSYASNLVPGDTNGREDVFVHDRATGATERVSVSSDGAEANSYPTSSPAISADGRHVAFLSFASNLVPGDTNWAKDVFVHDLATGATERVSMASDGAEANSGSITPAISADGRHVAFSSIASNLVPGDTNEGAWEVFVHDRATGATERVLASDGTGANSHSFSGPPVISADGRHVAFPSDAFNLVPRDTNVAFDVFVHDRATGATERVSVASDGAEANSESFWAAISTDGPARRVLKPGLQPGPRRYQRALRRVRPRPGLGGHRPGLGSQRGRAQPPVIRSRHRPRRPAVSALRPPTTPNKLLTNHTLGGLIGRWTPRSPIRP